MTTLTPFELEGMAHGCFNMAKDESIQACREYREDLEKQGYKTKLVYFSGDLFRVEVI